MRLMGDERFAWFDMDVVTRLQPLLSSSPVQPCQIGHRPTAPNDDQGVEWLLLVGC